MRDQTNEDAKQAHDEAQRYTLASLDRWKEMLAEDLTENKYHTFLSEHAGLFLSTNLHDALVISKLKLGNDLETDFVVVRDDYSLGLHYTLIEIEVPHCRLFTALQKPSDRLNSALAQIHSWKRWIDTYRAELVELLPSKNMRYGGPAAIEYMIVIGRRDSENSDDERKNDIERSWTAQFHGVRIRSFDFLTSNATSRFWEFFNGLYDSTQASAYPSASRPDLMRLDWQAVSHSQWREMVRSGRFEDCHLLEKNSELILRYRTRARLEQ